MVAKTRDVELDPEEYSYGLVCCISSWLVDLGYGNLEVSDSDSASVTAPLTGQWERAMLAGGELADYVREPIW